jgi:hypothetical protein
MLRSRIYNGRSILCIDLAAPESEDVGNLEKTGADHPLLSRDHARGVRFVASCEPARTLAEESIAGSPAGPVPQICEPCGVWVSLDASPDS